MKVVFGKLIPVPKLCKKISTMCIYDVSIKITTICNAKFGDSGDKGTGGQNIWSKVPYLESPTLICLFTIQLLWGYNVVNYIVS